MTDLNPLAFPEDRNAAPASKSPFPYTSVQPGSQVTADNISRMQQLENMLQEAQGRAEIIEKEAYDKAYLAGEKAGMALGKKRGEQILESLQETLKGTEAELQSMRQQFADACMDVAVHLAESMIGDTIRQDKTTLLKVARHAASQLPDCDELHLAVSPDDFSLFKRLLEDDNTLGTLSSDPTVESGSCRIISQHQDILVDPVAAMKTYLNELRPALTTETLQADAAENSDESRD